MLYSDEERAARRIAFAFYCRMTKDALLLVDALGKGHGFGQMIDVESVSVARSVERIIMAKKPFDGTSWSSLVVERPDGTAELEISVMPKGVSRSSTIRVEGQP